VALTSPPSCISPHATWPLVGADHAQVRDIAEITARPDIGTTRDGLIDFRFDQAQDLRPHNPRGSNRSVIISRAPLSRLPPVVIFSGVPFRLFALCKNRNAALRFRLAVTTMSRGRKEAPQIVQALAVAKIQSDREPGHLGREVETVKETWRHRHSRPAATLDQSPDPTARARSISLDRAFSVH
jgi:hypothetical protein